MKVYRRTRDNVIGQKKKKSKTQRINELSTALESETRENRKLLDQVEFLTTELQRERYERERQAELYQREQAKFHREYTLRMELSKQLEKLHNDKQYMKSQKEHETLTSAIARLQQALEGTDFGQKVNKKYARMQEFNPHSEKFLYDRAMENMLLLPQADYEEDLSDAQSQESVES